MLLVIDIGNTSVALGLYQDGEVQAMQRVITAGATPEVIAAALHEVLDGQSCVAAAIASVVPAAVSEWERHLKALGCETVFVVSHEVDLGISLDYPKPERIGPDRLANAAGVRARYGAPAVVADFGTALTFDVLTKEGEYRGGVIAPGLSLMFDYLNEKTALLPQIEPKPIEHTVGKSTEEAMRIGAQVGYRGMVDAILDVLERDLGEQHLTVVATGGYARWVLEGCRHRVQFDDTLTLYGIGKIFELNAV